MLSDQDYEKKVSSRTTRQTVGLYFIRAIVNLLTAGILVGVVIAIYFAQDFADTQVRCVLQVHRLQDSLIATTTSI